MPGWGRALSRCVPKEKAHTRIKHQQRWYRCLVFSCMIQSSKHSPAITHSISESLGQDLLKGATGHNGWGLRRLCLAELSSKESKGSLFTSDFHAGRGGKPQDHRHWDWGSKVRGGGGTKNNLGPLAGSLGCLGPGAEALWCQWRQSRNRTPLSRAQHVFV